MIFLVVAVMAVILMALGRRWWCKCGRPTPWTSAVTTGCNSQHLADPYSLTHFEHGVLMYAVTRLLGVPVGWTLFAVALMEATWECIENTNWAINRYRKVTISRGYTGDTIANSIGDVACCLTGAAFALAVPAWASAGTMIAFELLLAWWIRDNLSINILMLIWPVQFIRQWQEGN